MEPVKIGELIKRYRTNMGLTQKQLAERINVSDKAVSKWECGNGCPDISLMGELADVFGTDINVLIAGEANINESEKGDMKKIRFYVCKDCGNIITALSESVIICCGTKLSPLEARKAESSEELTVNEVEGELYITSNHEMTKEHYISFAAYVNDSSVMIFRQYPEWSFQVRMPLYRSGKLFRYCSDCGLLYQELK